MQSADFFGVERRELGLVLGRKDCPQEWGESQEQGKKNGGKILDMRTTYDFERTCEILFYFYFIKVAKEPQGG